MVGSSSRSNISLPAMAASFDTTVSRATKNTSKQNHETSLVQDTFNIDSYTYENEKDNKSIEAKKKNFSQLLATETKRTINFSDCKLKNNYATCELTKDVSEPTIKKRKIKMLPVEFNECLSGTSTSTDNVDNPKISQQISQEVTNDTDKKVMGKTYLKEVNANKCDM